VQTPPGEPRRPSSAPGGPARPLLAGRGDGLWTTGERLTLVSGLVLAVSAFTGWYVGSGEGLTISVVGWDTGALGKLVFAIGVALLVLVALHAAGIELPAAVPESLLVIALGSLATILVLVRVLSIPDRFLPADGRGVGLWISLVAAIGVIVAGLLQAAEEV
jgi:hypothetical protein